MIIAIAKFDFLIVLMESVSHFVACYAIVGKIETFSQKKANFLYRYIFIRIRSSVLT